MVNLFGRVGECQTQSCDMKYSWTFIKRPPAQVRIWEKYWPISFLDACSRKGGGGGGRGVIQTGYWPVPFSAYEASIIKNLADFRKTVETGMDPLLLGLCYGVFADQFVCRHILGHIL